jgi:hypothetical protein
MVDLRSDILPPQQPRFDKFQARHDQYLMCTLLTSRDARYVAQPAVIGVKG